jgi:hypothetical protein
MNLRTNQRLLRFDVSIPVGDAASEIAQVLYADHVTLPNHLRVSTGGGSVFQDDHAA